eukprot:TRINITY_DN5848_c0_g2_i1.p1 TRINITY_DN5848_c0_g2~~TRINITY_DN5848_c0_g2_i1.p1  ORF type:complete len:128 (+),score=3.26 TRINITY_DN5848_c0_g2_i1:26-385(+)
MNNNINNLHNNVNPQLNLTFLKSTLQLANPAPSHQNQMYLPQKMQQDSNTSNESNIYNINKPQTVPNPKFSQFEAYNKDCVLNLQKTSIFQQKLEMQVNEKNPLTYYCCNNCKQIIICN